MRLLSTNITSLYKSQIKIIQRDEAFFNSPFHSHPEFELVYIMKGFGKRIIGNKVEEFNKGEIILIGPNVPHIWISDKSFYLPGCEERSKSLVVYFNPEIFSDSFYAMEESFYLKRLFLRSQNGIKITGHAKAQTLLKLKKLAVAENLEKIICLLDILNTIANTDELTYINEQSLGKREVAPGRLTDLFDYVHKNYQSPIRLKQAAQIINLAPESFCRFFKQKTGKNFIEYLHETRISYACQSLLNTDCTVAEIAYRTGFKTASNFTKLFKKITGNSPTEYRKTISSNPA